MDRTAAPTLQVKAQTELGPTMKEETKKRSGKGCVGNKRGTVIGCAERQTEDRQTTDRRQMTGHRLNVKSKMQKKQSEKRKVQGAITKNAETQKLKNSK